MFEFYYAFDYKTTPLPEQTAAGIAVYIGLLFLNETTGSLIQTDWPTEVY